MGFDAAALSRFASEGWWSRSGSNRRPQACKARALPTELRPQKSVQSGLPSRSCGRKPVFAPKGSDAAAFATSQRRLVGPGRVERPTSRLSGVRSNHLSYEPETAFRCVSGSLRQDNRDHPAATRTRLRVAATGCRRKKEGKRRRRFFRHMSKTMFGKTMRGFPKTSSLERR